MKKVDYPVKQVPITSVQLSDEFWRFRLENNRLITIPHVLRKLEKSRRIANFELAGDLRNNKRPSKLPFDDSDVFKTLEGVAHSLKLNPDPKLEEVADNIIEKIAAAQEADGYLYTNRTINPENPHPLAGRKRWENVSIFSHELYNVGHLYEAAATYFEATGKKNLLEIALKNIELINKEFGYNEIENPPGHQEIELGLIRVYRLTGDIKYLELAKFFLDIRGSKKRKGYLDYLKLTENNLPWTGPERLKYNQSHKAVTEQREAVGHAVRATYMYSAMAEIAALYNDDAYLTAVNSLWEDVVSNKISITGGIGAKASFEGFDAPYLLPNLYDRRNEKGVYNETCASIGSIFWSYRLFLLHTDAKYIDILERTLYNGLLSGISLEGNKFFYPNPLASKGDTIRKSWFDVACCPTNIVRFIPQVQGYIYATTDDTCFINLFIGSRVHLEIKETEVNIVQKTRYPWDGIVEINVNPKKRTNFSIALRIPGWSQNRPVPSDLYKYLKQMDDDMVHIHINDQLIEPIIIENGFCLIKRDWKEGDKIVLEMKMPIRRVLSHPRVESNLGKVAIERGPLVYCFESIDNPEVFKLKISDDDELIHEYRNNLLRGIETIKAMTKINGSDTKEIAYGIPYYAWAHRGRSEMVVWVFH